MVSREELSLLRSWKLKLALLAAVVMPSVTATGAYYKLQIQLTEKNQQTENRVSDLELRTHENFADKPTMDQLRTNVEQMRNDITEIKTILRNKL